MVHYCPKSQISYYAHVLFTRTDFPFDPDKPHLHTYKRICESVPPCVRAYVCWL